MQIKVNYFGQLKMLAGVSSETVELTKDESGTSGWRMLLQSVSQRHGDRLKNVLLAENSQPGIILMFLDDQHVQWATAPDLYDGASVTLMTPISGG